MHPPGAPAPSPLLALVLDLPEERWPAPPTRKDAPVRTLPAAQYPARRTVRTAWVHEVMVTAEDLDRVRPRARRAIAANIHPRHTSPALRHRSRDVRLGRHAMVECKWPPVWERAAPTGWLAITCRTPTYACTHCVEAPPSRVFTQAAYDPGRGESRTTGDAGLKSIGARA